MHIRSIAGAKLRIGIIILLFTVILPTIKAAQSNTTEFRYSGSTIYVNESELKNYVLKYKPAWKPQKNVRWTYLKPRPLDYNNTKNCDSNRICIDRIKYEAIDIAEHERNRNIKLSHLKFINGPGTYIISTMDSVGEVRTRIAVRRGNDYVGYISELIGVPFVYWPRDIRGQGHQTDNGIGADCIATLIYGRRRQGKRLRYFAPSRLYDYTKKIGNSEDLSRTKVKRGDVLHFGFQTAVLSQDLPPIGQLSKNDKIIHSYHKLVEEVSLSQIPYRNMPFDILRWRE